ncbi:MAG: hypothetical protein JNM27_22515 [Leptospirales bacterium]|nr:hypothetical protein [Leptospirales bacterium]
MRLLRTILGYFWRELKLILNATPLSSEEQAFVKANTDFWNESKGKNRDAFVLVEFVEHEAILLANAATGAICAQAKGLKMLFLTNSSTREPINRILKSYPDCKFVRLNSVGYWIPRAKGWLAARKAMRTLKTVDDVLAWKLDGVVYGDILYDSFLARGYATLREVSQVRETLVQLLMIYYTYKRIIAKHKIETAIISQLMGVYPGTLGRMLLARNVEIQNRMGSSEIMIRKYRDKDEPSEHPAAPTMTYFERMLADSDASIVHMAEDYLDRRFGGKLFRLDAKLAFSKDRKVYDDRTEFCADYKLDSKKPLVFLMLHAFNDYPHWNYPRHMIYRDYFEWFEQTLAIVQDLKDVNWIVKEHPTQRYYRTFDLDLDVYMKPYENSPNIRFLNADTKLNTGSLRHIAHAIVTGVGTPGLEFATFGIPCLLGGEGPYSGFGFTREPRTATEYARELQALKDAPRLDAEAIRRAKVVAFFYFCIANCHPFHFCPHFDQDQLSRWAPETTRLMWARAAEGLIDPDHKKKLRQQIQELSEFFLDNTRIHSIDLKQFPFLRV